MTTLLKSKLRLAGSFALLAVFVSGLAAQTPVFADENPWPSAPPAAICGNTNLLGGGPETAPSGAFIVPAGDNEGLNLHQANTTYWFAPGVHTLGTDIYGQIIPGDNSTYLGAPGAVLDGQNVNRFAFTQHAQNVTIKYLEIRNFGPGAGNNDEGVVNHDAGVNWTIEYNYVHDNDGAGVFLGSDTKVRYNCLKDNGQYGFSSYHPDGVTNVLLANNEITGNNQDNWEALRDGCGCTGGGKFWDTRGAVIANNWVHNNKGTGLWADHNNADFLFEGNYIEENDGIGLFYEVSYNFMIRNNAFVRNAVVDGKARATAGDPFPSAAIYISESGGNALAGSQYAASEITGNLFEDNWDGIALWENADRFCRPGEEFDTTNGCPFFDQTWGTRYKTQNIKIHENKFSVDRQAIGCTNDFCARNAMFSNYGTHPANSPYLGTVIQEAITHQQNNQWLNNEYYGDWLFLPHNMDNHINFASWQAAPYNQEAGSTYDGDPGTPGVPPADPPSGPPAPVIENDLDADTSSLEGSAGQWSDWYSANTSRSTTTAHSGTHSLKVDVTAPWGWGVEAANWPGFESTEGTKVISLWGKVGSGTNLQPKMRVNWLDSNYVTLKTDVVTLPTLTATWQQATAIVEAPAGTATALVYLLGSGTTGDSLYLDDMVVGAAPNAVSGDSSTFENSAGQWSEWYSATVAATTEDAHRGTGSLKVGVTHAWGWAAQVANWPGFDVPAGEKRVSFWAKQGNGTVSNATLRVKWLDAAGQLVQTDLVTLNSLTTNWQQGAADVVAPAGTTHVFLEMYSTSGAPGDVLLVDDIAITDAPQ